MANEDDHELAVAWGFLKQAQALDNNATHREEIKRLLRFATRHLKEASRSSTAQVGSGDAKNVVSYAEVASKVLVLDAKTELAHTEPTPNIAYAEKALREAIKIATDADPYIELAKLLNRKGEHKEGIVHLRKAREIDPRNMEAAALLNKAEEAYPEEAKSDDSWIAVVAVIAFLIVAVVGGIIYYNSSSHQQSTFTASDGNRYPYTPSPWGSCSAWVWTQTNTYPYRHYRCDRP